jgi:gamma-glutamyltranspeptidase/glutathione hydrolase
MHAKTALLASLSVLVGAGPAARARGVTIPEGQWQAAGKRGIVVAGGRGSVEAGLTILRAGGNAVDAAVATLLALTVTDGHNFAFGSEVVFMHYDARRKTVETLSGVGVAPALATRAHFVALAQKAQAAKAAADAAAPRRPAAAGPAPTPTPTTGAAFAAAPGALAIPGSGLAPAAVPGAFDALVTALARSGTRRFAEVVAPTLALLDRKEKPWHADLARTLRVLVDAERAAGADRSRGLRLVADAFYRGPVARAIDAWSRKSGGLLRFSDLATHATRVEEPVSAAYRGFVVYKPGPFTQGPYLLEALQILEGFDLKALGANHPETVHLMVEALKLGLADRDVYYADPNFVDVPMAALLSPAYARLRRGLVDPERASREQRPGDPRAGKPLLAAPEARAGIGGPSHDTTTCLVADAAGNVVAATPSGWSGVLAGDTGVWLGTRLQSFNLWEGHPNALEPGKRPRVTLTPTIALKDGKPVIAVSVAGGDQQDQTTLQLLADVIDFGMTPAQAVTAPRFATNHHTGSFRQSPAALGSLETYETLGGGTIAALRARGHAVTTRKPPLSDPTIVVIDPETRRFSGAGDPAAGRHAGAL